MDPKYWGPFYSLPPSWATHLFINYNNPNLYSDHDIVLTSAPFYQTGPLGTYYLSSASPTVNHGSRSPAQAGLYQYTTRVDQVADASQSWVNIGLHYVATANDSTQPKDSNNDGIPDYIGDANGNGPIDATETPVLSPIIASTYASNDVFQVAQNSTLNSLTPLANDADSQGLPLAIWYPRYTTTTPHGSVTPSANFKSLIYTPATGFWGVDTFTYAIVNDFNRVVSATASVFVKQTGNQAPVPAAPADNPFVVTLGPTETSRPINLLSLWTDSDPLQVYSISPPTLGTVTINGALSAGQITYTRAANIAGSDIFRYVVTDGKGGAAIGTVQVNRNTGDPPPGDTPPIAYSYSTSVKAGQSITLPLLASDPDPGATLTYGISQGPQHGTFTPNPPLTSSTIQYTPASGYVGPDSILFYASDGQYQSAVAGITLHVQRENTAPITDDISVRTGVNQAVAIHLSAKDPDGDRLTYAIVTTTPATPQHGLLSGTPPDLLYTPSADFEGVDSFQFKANDGKNSSLSPGTVSITVTRIQLITLSEPHNNYTFRGDFTYYVTGPITLSGTTKFEGGTVIKFEKGTGAKLTLTGPVTFDTSLYRPAIFTGKDDDSVGAILADSNGFPSQHGPYADAALEMPAAGGSTLKYVRVLFANTAVRYPANTSGSAPETVKHVQIDNCVEGFHIDGTLTAQRQLYFGNVLVDYTGSPFAGSHWEGNAEHLTVDNTQNLVPDDTSVTLHAKNSVLTQVPTLGTANLDGSNNGFDTADIQFGANPIIDNSPYAPNATFIDLPNSEGIYYLNPTSLFTVAGDPGIDSALKAEFAQMTSFVPQLLDADITSSQTLAPVIPRDTGVSNSLGYHYPVIDYVANGATVNNCTLNIDQGTIIAFTAPWFAYEWGLRLNPGARLNVNGVPTNRVTFVTLESVQDYAPAFAPYVGEFFTFKGVILPSGTPVTPYPEAHFHYADFVSLAGDSMQLAPLVRPPLDGADDTFDMIKTLELDGCQFQNGTFYYETGGPQGRTVTLRNNIFEHAFIVMQNFQPGHGSFDENNTAVNNLFYGCDFWLQPVSGVNWTFTDNIFDQSSIHGSPVVTVNKDNAYINMSANHLSPGTESGINPNLTSLTYDSGPLGHFYLPASATQLLGKGSRTAANAGLYHFTSLNTANSKELNATVNIGPAYVGIDASGRPIDTDGDGMPDYAENESGTGSVASGETDWTVADVGPVRIVGLEEGNSLPPGRVRIVVQATNRLGNLASVSLTADGLPIPNTGPLTPPYSLPLAFEVDTARLANGLHYFTATASWSDGPDGSSDYAHAVDSDSIGLNTFNNISFADWIPGCGPNASGQYTVNVTAKASSPPASLTMDLYDNNLNFVDSVNGSAALDGSIQAIWQGNSAAHTYVPVLTAYWPDGSHSQVVTPAKIEPSDNWPETYGAWTVAGSFLMGDSDNFSDWTDAVDGMTARFSDAGPLVPPPGPEFDFQPLHYGTCVGGGADYSTRISEWKRLLDALPCSRNMYYFGHAADNMIGNDRVVYASSIQDMLHTRDAADPNRHAFRFVFLDGCEGMKGTDWATAFGAIPGLLVKDDPADWKDKNTRPYAFVGWQKKIGWGKPGNETRLVAQHNDGDEGHPSNEKGTFSGTYTCESGRPEGIQPEFIYYRTEFVTRWTGNGMPPRTLADALNEAYNQTQANIENTGVHVAYRKSYGMIIYGYSALNWQQCNGPDWRADLP